ncbi:hypothetical protein JTE90_026897 [Oedothorax gibbosus]|uniref:S-phase kinase-associated protein 1 n=1 Tax=Oedothorax gibbosus TaxID=931172 RepID=A0AAV6UC64_9ARAC|nr:hypothetical protein JTE90_026897 [Oedothorax gibbosus]
MIKLSTTLKTMLDNLGCEGSDEVISLTKINSEIMNLIVSWMKHHVDNKDLDTECTNPIGEVDDYVVHSCEDIDPWDEKLLESLEMATIFELSMACNYLDIKSLLGSTCKFIASKIRGKEPAEIRKVFNLPEAKSDSQSASTSDHR